MVKRKKEDNTLILVLIGIFAIILFSSSRFDTGYVAKLQGRDFSNYLEQVSPQQSGSQYMQTEEQVPCNCGESSAWQVVIECGYGGGECGFCYIAGNGDPNGGRNGKWNYVGGYTDTNTDQELQLYVGACTKNQKYKPFCPNGWIDAGEECDPPGSLCNNGMGVCLSNCECAPGPEPSGF